MKEQRQDYGADDQNAQSLMFKQLSKKIQHPDEQYNVAQLYSIRKESSNMANDQIYKKLTKSFHRIKKLRAQPNGNAIIAKQFDYESNSIRLTFKRARELYNQVTKTNLIVKKKIDKMRSKVDRIKNEIQTSELSLISEVDINKIYARGSQTNPAQISPNNTTSQQQIQMQQNTNGNKLK